VSALLAAGRVTGLRPLREEDVGERYLAWMRDPEVLRYLEARFAEQTLDSLRAFVRANADRDDTLLLAICALVEDERHIGNIKVGPLHPHHGTADIGLIIGERSWWGCGAGREAIALATQLAAERLRVRKLTASCYASHVGSAKAFLANGWVDEGRRPAQFVGEDGVEDQWMLGLVLREAP
jgi:[ribosomal protein S5]-alanine N-acetyltransferase